MIYPEATCCCYDLRMNWDIRSTGPISLLDGINYSHRILIPIYWENKQVTFQARDVTDKHPLKYMACPKNRELIHHKHIVYRHPEAQNDIGIAVEGVTDVWRFGKVAFATFGIEYTRQQVRLIAGLYKEVIVIFDDEPQAQRKAKELVADLQFRGVPARSIIIKGDPGSMSQKEANKLLKQIL